MANTYNWRFFQDTGLEGGVTASNGIMYVDSYNGSDVTGTGEHDNPVQTIQGALDLVTSAKIILAGYFEEDGIVGSHSPSLIAEGNVIIDGNGASRLGTNTYGNSWKVNWSSSHGRLRFGTFTFKNYSNIFPASTPSQVYCYDSVFINCTSIWTNGNAIIYGFSNNLVVNGTLGTFGASNAMIWGYIGCNVEHNTFINSNVNGRVTSFITAVVRANYFDVNSTFWIYGDVDLLFSSGAFDYNHFEGTLVNKFRIGTSLNFSDLYYDNTEELQAARPAFAINDIASTTDPLFNDPSGEDYTLQPTSPLLKAGHDKKQIGAFNLGSTHSTNDTGVFDYVNIDTTTSGEITLSGGGSGTATTKTLQHHELDVKKRLITKTLSPNLEQNFGLGETMGNLAADNTPPKTDIEIQYSTSYSLTNGVDGTASYNGAWLRVPIGEQPYHDTVNNVGNDDPLFDIDNAITIRTRYIKMRITLRDDESPLV